MNKLITVILGFSSILSAYCQELPEQFLYPAISFPFVNPAFSTYDSSYAAIGSQFHFNEFSDIHTTHALYCRNLKTENPTSHRIGMIIYNDNEANLFKRNRFLALYNLNLPLSETWNARAGITLGVFQIFQRGNAFLPDIQERALDAHAGFLVYNQQWQFGLSINQLFNNQVRGEQLITQLQRHYNLTTEKNWRLNNVISGNWLLNLRVSPGTMINLDVLSTMIYIDKMTTGISWQYGKGVIFHAGLRNIPLYTYQIDIISSYQLPGPKARYSNIETLELNLSVHK